MNRDSFIFYRSYYEAIKDLPRDIQGDVYTAIMEYSLNGITTDNLKPIARAIFTLIKPTLDSTRAKYENGTKGGRPKNKTEEKPNNNLDKTKPKPYVDKDVDEDKDLDEDNLLLEKEAKGDSDFFEKEIEELKAKNEELQAALNSQKEKKVAAKKEKEEQRVEGSAHGDGVLHYNCLQHHSKNPTKYPLEFYEEFLGYWTTILDNGVERWRYSKKKDKEFDVSRRLATSWGITGKNFNNDTKQFSNSTSSRIDRSNKRAREAEELERAGFTG